MSGTSLDGVDIALCDISTNSYSVLDATTIPYPDTWRQRLSTLEKASALEYALANVELGHYLGQLVRDFMQHTSAKVQVEAVASHGHTIFHQPERGLTTQIGDGDAIAAECGLPVVSNFRTLDVALGGQGAPLVPIGDRLLFGQYDACLNLGGIGNISYQLAVDGWQLAVDGCQSAVDGCQSAVDDGKEVTIAYDICPCNMLLNGLAARLGLSYDPDGQNARRGIVDAALLATANTLPYYSQQPPKTLGKEWFLANIEPLFAREQHAVDETCNLLRTAVEHIAMQIAQVVNRQQLATMLVTGGGAHNTFLIERLRQLCPQTLITIPDTLTIDYKEAIVFALLGYLRLTHQTNTLSSVTGASRNTISGTISGHVQMCRQFV